MHPVVTPLKCYLPEIIYTSDNIVCVMSYLLKITLVMNNVCYVLSTEDNSGHKHNVCYVLSKEDGTGWKSMFMYLLISAGNE